MPHVLVVDHDPAAAALVAAYLSECGHEARAADSADRALALARQQTPDVLVCSAAVRNAAGISLVEILAARLPALRIFLVSGHSASVLLARHPGSRGVELLRTPVDLEALEARLCSGAASPALTAAHTAGMFAAPTELSDRR